MKSRKKNYENKTILQKQRWKKKPSVSHSRAEVNHGCNEKLFSLSLTKIQISRFVGFL